MSLEKVRNEPRHETFLRDVANHCFKVASAHLGVIPEAHEYDKFRGTNWTQIVNFAADENSRGLVLETSTDGTVLAALESVKDGEQVNAGGILVTMVKSSQKLDVKTAVEDQIFAISSSHAMSLASFSHLMTSGVSSILDHAIKSGRAMDVDEGLLYRMRSKMNELSKLVANMDSKVVTPDMVSDVHPLVSRMVEEGANTDNFGSYLNEQLRETSLLNFLQATVIHWTHSLQKLTDLTREVRGGTLADEVVFWDSVEKALVSVHNQTMEQGIKLTVLILQEARRLQTAFLHLSETAVVKRLKEVKAYNLFLGEIPISELHAVNSLDQLSTLVVELNMRLKKIKIYNYPVTRAQALLELLAEEFVSAIYAHVPELGLLEFKDFNASTQQLLILLKEWDDLVRDQTLIYRELVRKRSEKIVQIKPDSRTGPLRLRIKELRALRCEIQEWQNDILEAGLNKYDYLLSDAYEPLASINCLKCTSGTWNAAREMCTKRIISLETKITSVLRFKLNRCDEAAEMFTVLESFQSVLSRARLRANLQDYHRTLLTSVLLDLSRLKDRLSHQVLDSQVSRLIDLPASSSDVMRSRNIEKRTKNIMTKITLIFGNDWKDTKEGRAVYKECQLMLAHTQQDAIVRSWLSVAALDLNLLEAPVLEIHKEHNTLYAHVSSNHLFQKSFKEVRNLKWLGYSISRPLEKSSEWVRRIYPEVIELSEVLDTFIGVVEKVNTSLFLKALLSDQIRRAFCLLSQCMETKWGTLGAETTSQEVNEFNSSQTESRATLAKFKALSSEIIKSYGITENANDLLRHAIQSVSAGPFLEEVLKIKLEQIVYLSKKFTGLKSGNVGLFLKALNSEVTAKLLRALQGELGGGKLPKTFHRVKVINGRIKISPQLETTKSTWINYTQCTVDTAIHSLKLFMTLQSQNEADLPANALSHFTCKASSIAKQTLGQQYSTLKTASKAFNKWIKYEALWTMAEEILLEGSTLAFENCSSLYMGLIEDLKTLQSTESHLEFSESLSFSLHDVKHVAEVMLKKWQEKLLCELVALYTKESNVFHQRLHRSRSLLEMEIPPLIISSLDDYYKMFIEIEELKGTWDRIESHLSLFQTTYKIIKENRSLLTYDAVTGEQLDLDLISLKQILSKRADWIEKVKNFIFSGLEQCFDSIKLACCSLEQDWNKEKETDKNTTPTAALDALATMSSAIENQQRLLIQVNKILSILSHPTKSLQFFSNAPKEVADQMRAWDAIKAKWSTLELLTQTKWDEVVLPELKRRIEEILAEQYRSPAYLQSNAVFNSFFTQARFILSAYKQLEEIKDVKLNIRHWNSLIQKNGGNPDFERTTDPASMTLSDVLSVVNNNVALAQILNEARSEAVLECSLTSIEDHWKNAKFKRTKHSSGQIVVKEWKYLFELITDDIETLHSMKNSAHHKHFDNLCESWELKLNNMASIFTDWAEAQRLWLYLYAALSDRESSNPLEAECSKFQGLSLDLSLLLSNVFESDMVTEVLNMRDFHKRLRFILESLRRLMECLNNYLDSQREHFPRLYFLGNEDILQLMGATKDLQQASSLFGKLYMGISSVCYENQTITGVLSREGELLLFEKPVDIEKHSKMKDWLVEVDSSIKSSVLTSTEICLRQLKTGGIELFCQIFDHCVFQAVLLSLQIWFTSRIEQELELADFECTTKDVACVIDELTKQTQTTKDAICKKKAENLIIECIHIQSLLKSLSESNRATVENLWASNIKYYYHDTASASERIKIRIGDHFFNHGLEYIGIPERLIYTPLLQNCFTALTHALAQKKGGSPFGPAGTGKTETIKALGQNLGRMVLVFNCDDSFDFQSMGRLLFGIAQVGAWGCFDEFNRLEENIMSAVSSQIGELQDALSKETGTISLLGKSGPLNQNTGVFVTMNPGYEGRRELPDNLRNKFRLFSMREPNNSVIAEVILATFGFREAKVMSLKVTCFLDELRERCSDQKHYDFGLRTMKAVLRNCKILRQSSEEASFGEVLLRSLYQLIEPRLEEKDVLIFGDARSKLFPDVKLRALDGSFSRNIESACLQQRLAPTDEFIQRCSQFYHIQKSQHATIISGPPASGKSCVWKTTLKVLNMLSGAENIVYVLDPKVLSKSQLYGFLDPVTFEWSDGLFSFILRQITQDSVGTFRDSRVWFVFDGDLDPDYVETINSVLDDNRVFTLPNGERLNIPSNVNFIFEVGSLEALTPATISRCAVIVLSGTLCTPVDVLRNFLFSYMDRTGFNALLDEQKAADFTTIINEVFDKTLLKLCDVLEKLLDSTGTTLTTVIGTFVSLICSKTLQCIELVQKMQRNAFQQYLRTSSFISILWAMTSACNEADRFSIESRLKEVLENSEIQISSNASLTDYFVSPQDQKLTHLSSLVPRVSLESHQVLSPDLMITTLDTLKHERFVFDLLSCGKSLILCGPPGSGKTMTLNNALKNSNRFELIGMTFSKETSVDTILKLLKHHTNITENAADIIMRPKSLVKDLVIFCDEINLPLADPYGVQPPIMLLRQMLEKQGFWHVNTCKWVRLERIVIVGACNPPDGSARQMLSARFTRFTPFLSVEYPGTESLRHIYETMFQATFKLIPDLREYAKDFANASIDLYHTCCRKFSRQKRSHYIFSPRDLTRWVKGMHFIATNSSIHGLCDLLELWIYEASRLFSDRLVDLADKQAFRDAVNDTVSKFFPGLLETFDVEQDILFTNWVTAEYSKKTRVEVEAYVSERLKVFTEEELECSLIPTKFLLDHMVRVDRVFKQEQGHCILVGPNRSAKRSLVRFVSWLNGMEVVQLIVHRNFHLFDFDKLLKSVMIKCAMDNQKVVLMVDDSSILDPGFIERMNTLLANSDVPGLFEGEERLKLITDLAKRAEKLGLLLDSNDELYVWFTRLISQNLHVVFTINDTESQGASNVINSPALFNRCVLDWMGAWSEETFTEIGRHILQWMPLEQDYRKHVTKSGSGRNSSLSGVLVNLAVEVFEYYKEFQVEPLTHGKFFDQLGEFQTIYAQKSSELEHQQHFMSTGLETLKDSVLKVKDLNTDLSFKGKVLQEKEQEARTTLDKMLSTQNEAERKHEASIEIRKILEVQEKELTSQRSKIVEDLALVEPEILEAQRGVNNIKKQHMTEVRSMINPPKNVKRTLEAVCIILGHDLKEWRDIQHFIRKDEFISSIVHYDTSRMMDDSTKSFVEEEYLTKPDFNYHTANHASKACGPLFQWVVAQVKYSSMLTAVLPLRRDITEIEHAILQTKARLLAAEDMIVDYQKITEDSKKEYSSLIRDIEVIKSELNQVQQKVSRSENLLKSLATENSRWSNSIAKFNENKNLLVGDSFLSAICVTYCMGHDAGTRQKLLARSKTVLSSNHIEYDHNYNFSNYCVAHEDKSRWTDEGLPNEDLCIENFYTIAKGKKYSFIVDPEGIATDFIKCHYGGALTVTSFLDSGFIRRLKNALKFGSCILIEDGDYFDPIISTLISQEFKTVGGRQTIRIGEENVDVSSSFKLIISSKSGACPISGFVRARMSVVNFVIDKFSLQAQSLELVLEHEKPELCRKRTELRLLNGKYKLRLESLEEELLDALNGSDKGLLENDSLLSTLEQIKISAAEVEAKIEETRGVLEKVEIAARNYEVISRHAMRLFSVMEQLPSLQWSYQISIKSFLHCATTIFSIMPSADHSRPQQLLLNLYHRIFEFFSPSLTEDHKIVLGILLFTCYIELDRKPLLPVVFKELLSTISNSIEGKTRDILEDGKLNECAATTALSYIKDLDRTISEGCVFPELLRTLEFFKATTPLSLEGYIAAASNVPVLILSERGADDTYRISQLASSRSLDLLTISLGSLESTVMAEAALSECSHSGGWLLLQNLQMSPTWVNSVLTRRLDTILGDSNMSPNFRIFMTCDLESNNLPLPLLRNSWHLVQGRKRGILATAQDVWGALSHENFTIDQSAKLYCCFLIAWFHALLVENSSLHPLGFTQKYDFNDTDYSAGIFYLNTLFESIDDSSNIPWEKLNFNISAIIYGGKIDHERDLKLCTDLGSSLFTPNALNPGFKIASGILAPPKVTHKWIDYQEWFLQCPVPENWSDWLGFSHDLEKEQQKIQAQKIARSVLQVLDNY
ncbi:LAME_0G05182g1_1 [Lachancea meyersii CBS 8951]|uniref:Dynein heavy chain, cytoplasmic n=1 Tax=Lachancea meyersii CBS 8951 TaxID=1266667 RepID=A0A1G4K768_9SACH|nr:LAME_0G05182g1_1 [Lachancea meyersii CBS 8951]